MNHYGTPQRVIPLGTAAAAASMSRAELRAALGVVVVVGPNKLACTPAALDAVSPGASTGLRTFNAATDNANVDCGCVW